MTEKQIEEVMALVDAYASAESDLREALRIDVGVRSAEVASANAEGSLRAKLRELSQKNPLALYERDTIKANAWRETRDGGYWDVNEIISATERAHGIGEPPCEQPS